LVVLERDAIENIISKEERLAPGFKVANDLVTVMLGGNANEHYNLKPVVIYHPRALRGFLKSSLPAYWQCMKKS
jgi:hypothetical protein